MTRILTPSLLQFFRNYGKGPRRTNFRSVGKGAPQENARFYVMSYDLLWGQIQTGQLKRDFDLDEEFEADSVEPHSLMRYLRAGEKGADLVEENRRIKRAGGPAIYYKQLHSKVYDPSLEAKYDKGWAEEFPKRYLRSKFADTWTYHIVKHSQALELDQVGYVKKAVESNNSTKPLVMEALTKSVAKFGKEAPVLSNNNWDFVNSKIECDQRFEFAQLVGEIIGQKKGIKHADVGLYVQYNGDLNGYIATGMNVFLDKSAQLRTVDEGGWQNQFFIRCDGEDQKFNMFMDKKKKSVRDGSYDLYIPQILGKVSKNRS